MAEIWKGAPVAEALTEETKRRAGALREAGIVPTLAILRVGERPDDLAYERGAAKRCEKGDVAVRRVALPGDVGEKVFFDALRQLGQDAGVHGILMFQPLPRGLDAEKARSLIPAEKDVDGCTALSQARVYAGAGRGFAPCTAEAVMALLEYYGVDPCGARAVVIGRSLVIGRPAAMLLMQKNATVTLCHTRTRDVPALAREADILVTASGQMESVGAQYLREGQIVLDVGIGWSEEKQKLCGDVLFEEAEQIVRAVTPVPGGVGSVTSAILVRHVVEAAEQIGGQ